MAPLISRIGLQGGPLSGFGFGKKVGKTVADFTITPALNGITDWSLSSNGALVLDGNTQTTYTLVAKRSFSATVKMWGQASCNANGGYTYGTYLFTSGNTYTVQLNAGRGPGGFSFGSTSSDPGGGYAGLFNGSSASQGTALLIAGGGGGSGRNDVGCETAGGAGGGTTGGNGSNPTNSEVCGQGGGGASQSGAGGGAPGCGYNQIWGAPNSAPEPAPLGGVSSGALQGGAGGIGVYPYIPVVYVNAPGGGGGGGGYFGGGGGSGGNDYGNGTRSGGGGGGGSGYVHPSVTGGATSTFANSGDPNRGSAGAAAYGPARVVLTS